MATVLRGARVTGVLADAPLRSWKVRATLKAARLLLWRVNSVCHWLPLAPPPVPAAGTTNVAALAAMGRSAIAARIIIRFMFMRCFSFAGQPLFYQLIRGRSKICLSNILTNESH